jgi:hypothetical protein
MANGMDAAHRGPRLSPEDVPDQTILELGSLGASVRTTAQPDGGCSGIQWAG